MNSSGKFTDVLGFISQAERIALQKCVLETSGVAGDALEIGSLNGLSALLILSVLESSKILTCIEIGQVETLCENLMIHGLRLGANIVNNDFRKAEATSDELSFVFIDHDHTFENNCAAFNLFWPKLSSGGILAFHDYFHPDFKGGTDAIIDLRRHNKLDPYIMSDSFIAFKK